MATSTDILAELRGVTAGYRGSTILHDLGITIRRGGVTGIIGPNGAGKSTMLKVLLGYLAPEAGDVYLSGEAITKLAPEKRVAAGIAYIAQTRSFFTSQTIDENLLLGAYLVRDRQIIERRRDAVFARFPILRQRRRQIAGMLSGGEARMLEIGRMLMTAPRLAVLDEPSIGLSPKVIDQVYDHVRELCREGMTFLIVEQNVRKLLAVAGDIHALENGRNRFSGPPDVLSDRGLLAELYFGAGTRPGLGALP